jgi:hypothetical protein
VSDVKPGALIDATAQRDAIHVALAPVVAAERLVPGAPIGFVEGSTELVSARTTSPIGIVDPFLTAIVEREQRFWMFLYPNTITSLRHDWTHPAFVEVPKPPAPSRAASEKWLRDFCDTHDCPSYETIMKAIDGTLADADDYGRWGYLNDEYFYFSGRDAHAEIPAEFWTHVETVLGRPVPVKAASFSCSC